MAVGRGDAEARAEAVAGAAADADAVTEAVGAAAGSSVVGAALVVAAAAAALGGGDAGVAEGVGSAVGAGSSWQAARARSRAEVARSGRFGMSIVSACSKGLEGRRRDLSAARTPGERRWGSGGYMRYEGGIPRGGSSTRGA
ncbi:hypothetical protein [Polyangium sp. y55x31]|uniref:hypothetical protein n=1 Tax=Polyangium sp. y55x31 TaxID=3042688 RepID=UPI00248210B4|nr:hypothetical protein [Polyangium sp. y55x31]MDI1480457.1 hypothetical protein [Polyangium sp. y55x31]